MANIQMISILFLNKYTHIFRMFISDIKYNF